MVCSRSGASVVYEEGIRECLPGHRDFEGICAHLLWGYTRYISFVYRRFDVLGSLDISVSDQTEVWSLTSVSHTSTNRVLCFTVTDATAFNGIVP